jgi:hypothetical protein
MAVNQQNILGKLAGALRNEKIIRDAKGFLAIPEKQFYMARF